MNIYKIYQEISTAYDTYQAAIVVAESEEAARYIHPDGDLNTITATNANVSTWVTIEHVQVELIGVAKEGIQAGVILNSYHR